MTRWIAAAALAAVGLTAGAAMRPATAQYASPAAAQEAAAARLRIPFDDFKKMYDDDQVIVVDVRSFDAYRAGHIPGAISMPLDTVERRAGELKDVKKTIVTYCT